MTNVEACIILEEKRPVSKKESPPEPSKQIDNQLLQEINCIVFSLEGKHYLYDYPLFPE